MAAYFYDKGKSGEIIVHDSQFHPTASAIIDQEIFTAVAQEAVKGLPHASLLESAARYDPRSPRIPSKEWAELIGKYRQGIHNIADACRMEKNDIPPTAERQITNHIADILYTAVITELVEQATKDAPECSLWDTPEQRDKEHNRPIEEFLPAEGGSPLISEAKRFYSQTRRNVSSSAQHVLEAGGKILVYRSDPFVSGRSRPLEHREAKPIACDFFYHTLPLNVYALLRGDEPPLQQARNAFTELMAGEYPATMQNGNTCPSEYFAPLMPGTLWNKEKNGPVSDYEVDYLLTGYSMMFKKKEKGWNPSSEAPIKTRLGVNAFKALADQQATRRNSGPDVYR